MRYRHAETARRLQQPSAEALQALWMRRLHEQARAAAQRKIFHILEFRGADKVAGGGAPQEAARQRQA